MSGSVARTYCVCLFRADPVVTDTPTSRAIPTKMLGAAATQDRNADSFGSP